MDSNAWAAVIGAVTGFALAFLANLYFTWKQRAHEKKQKLRDRVDRSAEEAHLAAKAFVKVWAAEDETLTKAEIRRLDDAVLLLEARSRVDSPKLHAVITSLLTGFHSAVKGVGVSDEEVRQYVLSIAAMAGRWLSGPDRFEDEPWTAESALRAVATSDGTVKES
jgi:hypothetical protein